MNSWNRVSIGLVAGAVLCAGLPQTVAADEIDELRAAVIALQKRIDQLESRAKGVDDINARQEQQIEKVRGATPGWVNSITWRGDLRFRNEHIDQQYAPERNRYRIRARAGFQAKVNDTVRSEFALTTTEGNDPRASNQTLTGMNSRKPIELDLAYAEWSPNAQWRLTAGKMRYPLIRPGQSVFIDADINPEGLAATWTGGDFFAGVLYDLLEERATGDESALVASQLAWRPKLGPGKLTLGSGYMAYSGLKGRNALFGNASHGNTTTTVASACRTATPCLTNDYDQLEAFAEWSQPIAGRPLALYADVTRNLSAGNGLDVAWSAGATYGRASEPGSWELGYYYQDVEKDSLYAQLSDSDYGGGVTDSRGGVFKLGYAPARNWVINGSLFLNETNVDVPVAVTGVGSVRARDFTRLQLDLNYKY